MRKYRCSSLSAQARSLADSYYQGYQNKEEGLKDLKNSYRHPLIVQRAIKRYVRKMKREVV